MERVDVAVIGGGVLGCFAARHLCRWRLDTLLLEAEEDVCMGITRANSAIIYSGYDNKPGSRKAQMTVAANAGFATLCEELAVPFKRCGSLMVAACAEAEAVLQKKWVQGRKNGVPALQLLSGAEARALEPMLADSVRAALYAPTSGTVNPWQLGIAAFDNARQNGCQARLNSRVKMIRRDASGYLIETEQGLLCARAVVNAAGIEAAKVQESCFAPSIRLALDATDYLVLDRHTASPQHILFQEGASGKGITVVPTVEGTLLLEAPTRPLIGAHWATSRQGLAALRTQAQTLLPELALDKVIRSFAAVRPNPYLATKASGQLAQQSRDRGTELHDFVIASPSQTFISLLGVKTPGLTCADALGCYVASRIAETLGAAENPDFDPHRHPASEVAQDEAIVCQCEQVSKGDILAAIASGAHTLDGVKHRTGSGMGRCQGSRCRARIEALLKEGAHGKL